MSSPSGVGETGRTISVELHARAAEIAGVGAVAVSVPLRATAADVKKALAYRVPALERLLSSSALATEHEYLADGASIGSGGSFHLVPPVSGG